MREWERFEGARVQPGVTRPSRAAWHAPLTPPDPDVVICPGVRGRSCGTRVPVSADRILCRYCTRTVELLDGGR
jgi:hypothetical protein